MNRQPLRHRPSPLLQSFALCLAAVLAASAPLQAQRIEPDKAQRTLQLLEVRKQQQADAARSMSAFHAFTFTDRRAESGITFRNRVVDDAAKNWKPAHYDHGNAVASADVDGDGRPDLLFLTQLGSNQLWRNLGGGRFEDITAQAGIALKDEISVGASFADIDNDGDPDLFITTVRHGNHLFENLGGGRFRDITAEAGVAYSGHSSGAVFFDYDRDGRLDLLVCNVGRYTSQELGPGGFYRALDDAFAGHMHPDRTEYSLLYHNLGNRHFKEVSADAGIRIALWTGDGTFQDLNGDGLPDLYLVNMQGQDAVLLNQGNGRFAVRTPDYFPRTPWGAMGVKFFDYNNDGRMDLFVTDMHSDMTDRQRQLAMRLDLQVEKGKSDVWCAAQFQNVLAENPTNYVFGNAFYENQGGRFVERSGDLGLETFWPWGVSAGDLNADGYEDLFVTAGMGFPFRYAINSVLLNDAGRRFYDSEFLVGVEPRRGNKVEIDYFTLDCDGADKAHRLCTDRNGLQTIRGATSTRSSVVMDLDDDGDLDIVTNDFNDEPQVLINSLSTVRPPHYIQVRLVGSASNRDGLGARVQVKTGGVVQTRYHDGKSGYLAQSALPLYFGLGEADTIDRIEVNWPSGKTQVIENPGKANRLLTLTEP